MNGRAVIANQADFRLAQAMVNSDAALRTFAACEFEELNDDAKNWMAIILREATRRYRSALEAIQTAAIEGRICDDVAWFDKFTTLHDYIDGILDRSPPAAVADMFGGAGT